jgi:hypothetical protein
MKCGILHSLYDGAFLWAFSDIGPPCASTISTFCNLPLPDQVEAFCLLAAARFARE